MTMPSKMPISDFRSLDDTNRSLIVWQGLQDTWVKLMELIEHQTEVDADIKMHQKLLVTGNGEPSVMERLRNLEKIASRVERLSNAIILQSIAFVFTMIAMGIAFFFKIYPILARLVDP